jgi:hypothetical protein
MWDIGIWTISYKHLIYVWKLLGPNEGCVVFDIYRPTNFDLKNIPWFWIIQKPQRTGYFHEGPIKKPSIMFTRSWVINEKCHIIINNLTWNDQNNHHQGEIYQGVWFLDKMELYATMCHNIILNSSLDW